MEREDRIRAKIKDIEDQIAYAEAMGWQDRAQRQRQRLLLLRKAARMKPETAWKKAMEKGAEFAKGAGREALEDAILYAYAATGRGMSDAELLAAVSQELAKKGGR